ncbi:MAG: MBOAT family protein [Fibrobacterota bacterium]|nr:MBOAT family protein [Fibrobacterota bacterium]
MLFNSIHFLIFFPIVVLLYFSTPHKWRWLLLLSASYYFYMCWKPEYAILLAFTTIVDYASGYMMGRIQGLDDVLVRKRRRKYLVMSLVSNLGVLFTFKYFNFFNNSLVDWLPKMGVPFEGTHFDLLLPVGISFYTFQSIAYVVDVYYGKVPSERNIGIYALFSSFWPQLVAGPIERAGHILPQFREKHIWDWERVSDGLKQMCYGLFKKVVVADTLAVIVNEVYTRPERHSGLTLLVATYFFAFQIYCDFSGYSHIAIGAAKVMGFDLMKNFNRPYLATSVKEFWKRWHISLSTWFMSYVYIPLGGNRKGPTRTHVNLLIVFLVSGLWHGANWTYVVWGGLNGVYLVASQLLAPARHRLGVLFGLDSRPGLAKWVNILVTFHLVLITWVFFRASDLSSAFAILGRIARDAVLLRDLRLTVDTQNAFLAGCLLLFIFTINVMQERAPGNRLVFPSNRVLRYTMYALFGNLFFLLGNFDIMQFIYFQF